MSPVSVNYERVIGKKIALRGGVAYNWILGNHLALPFSVSYIAPFLASGHYVEVGGGTTFLLESPEYSARVFGTVLAAYRYQQQTPGIFLRPAAVLFLFEDQDSHKTRLSLWPALAIGFQF
jgi:hypothetical protein